MPITEAHILECYKAYINSEDCPYPQGMNATSAEMTMKWLACIFNDQRCNRGFGAMQCRVVLETIQVDFGANRAHEVALSIRRDIDLRHKNYGFPQYAHRQAIEPFLIM